MSDTAPRPGFADAEVCFTGRMASMARAEAVARLTDKGGHHVEHVKDTTAFLVVGLEGWPLSRDGRLTHDLEKAQEQVKAGGTIQILGEDEFLERLGLGERHNGIRRLYTIEQLERILQVPRATLRTWLRSGLIRPKKTVHRLCYFDFEQVASAKVLNELDRQGVTPGQIHQSLEQLQRWFPGAERSLAQLGILQQGGHLLVRLQSGQLAETSGQLYLQFGDDQDDAEADPTPRIHHDWHQSALEAEEAGELERAAECWQESLLSDGPHAEHCFNLANVLYGLGRKDAAAQRYLQAVEQEPAYVEAWNNLGNTLTELDQVPQAIRAFRRALAIEPDYPDPHFNLAEVLERSGDPEEARRHWEEYLRLDPNSSWARRVRERLGEDGPTEPPPS